MYITPSFYLFIFLYFLSHFTFPLSLPPHPCLLHQPTDACLLCSASSLRFSDSSSPSPLIRLGVRMEDPQRRLAPALVQPALVLRRHLTVTSSKGAASPLVAAPGISLAQPHAACSSTCLVHAHAAVAPCPFTRRQGHPWPNTPWACVHLTWNR